MQTLLVQHSAGQHPLSCIFSMIPIFLDLLASVQHHLKTSNQLPNLFTGTHYLLLSAAPTIHPPALLASDSFHSIHLALSSSQTTHSLLIHCFKYSMAI